MTDKVDRKLQEVRIGEYRYRHEAEFAAGFLADAGIPYRLQMDDAGGADLGLSMLRPAALWVRAVDAELARELVALDEDEDEAEPAPARLPSGSGRPTGRTDSRLARLERAVAAGLSVVFLGVAPNLPPMPLRDVAAGACAVIGLALLGTAAIGRAPGPLAGLIRMLAGSPPR